MKIWIEVDKGNMIECEEIKAVSVPDSVLVFETSRKMPKSYIDNFHAYIRERTGMNVSLLMRE